MASSNSKSALRLLLRDIVRKLRPKLKGRLAIGDVKQVALVYDDVFDNVENFDILDSSNKPKLKYVLRYVNSVNGRILDAGCGRGSVLRFMLDSGVDAFGIELSSVCVEKYLQGLPVAHADIVSWSNEGHVYDGCISTDVMEHIPPDQLDATLSALAKLAPSLFLGIANHSSIHNGHELHVIQEGIEWWKRKVGAHFSKVSVIEPDVGDTVLMGHFRKEVFFFIQAER